MENQENVKKTDAETDKTERFSAQVNLVKGSPKHQQIISIGNEMGAVNSGDVVKRLMDAYENPPKDADSAATIERLELQVSDLKAENAAYEATLQNNENEMQKREKRPPKFYRPSILTTCKTHAPTTCLTPCRPAASAR